MWSIRKGSKWSCFSVIADLLTSASSVRIGRLPWLWTGTCRANPLSRWAPHTGKHLKCRNTPEQILNLITPTRTPSPPPPFPFHQAVVRLYYVVWNELYFASTTHTQHTKNRSAYLQTGSTGCLWPRRLGRHALHGKRRRDEKCELWSLPRGLPEGRSHPGA